MGFIASFKAGRATTKMANLLEEVERNRKPKEEGYGSRLSTARLQHIEQEMQRNMDYLRSFPRHLVTENTLKNIRIASKFNDAARVQIYADLLQGLIEEGIALDLDTFEKSFTR
jgi:hypothetical protein